MSNWQSKKVDFGTMKKMSARTFEFQGLPGIPEIVDIKVECGCTKVKYDAATRILSVRYSAGNIPVHILNEAGRLKQPVKQSVNKKVTVVYKGGETEVLEIVGYKTEY